jgi:hypothetical protein
MRSIWDFWPSLEEIERELSKHYKAAFGIDFKDGMRNSYPRQVKRSFSKRS